MAFQKQTSDVKDLNLGNWVIVSLFLLCNLITVLIPSFQSPDEFEHIKRAYLFGRGDIVLSAPAGQSSGGMIDSGLARYMDAFSGFPFNQEKRVTAAQIVEAKTIRWTGTQEFSPTLGMTYYFPAIYVIHTASLRIGEFLGLTIDTSYRLTKFVLLSINCILLFFAFKLVKPTALVLALLLIPMSLFQAASASLDGIATAMAILMISVFIKITQEKKNTSPVYFYILITLWLLLASSRLQIYSTVLLVCVASYYFNHKKYLWMSLAAALAVIGWQLIVMASAVDGRVQLGDSSTNLILSYIRSPGDFVRILFATITDPQTAKGYFSSFFGILGWLDTPFSGNEYVVLLTVLAMIAAASVSPQTLLVDYQPRLLLLLCAFLSIVTIFFALLVTWTPHPTILVAGVQGRYFLIPALMVAYAMHNSTSIQSRIRSYVSTALVMILATYSAINTTNLLLERYYLAN
jgi:uncharacterized membrane protein